MDNSDFERIVHLDLKGAPPKIEVYPEFFNFIKSNGATGVLIEWEDTFPYTDDNSEIGSLNIDNGGHYTTTEVNEIITLALQSDLTVIPLVQTFGHMEFILKHEKWRHLREVEEYPSSICPSREETGTLVKSLIDQIISLHPHINFIHIGGDEVWHCGLCSYCQKKMESSKFGKDSLYMDHIVGLSQFIKLKYPDLTVLIWDDMLRGIGENVLKYYAVGELFQPMIWNYDISSAFFNQSSLWNKYFNTFSNIWIASAFKGATSSCQIIPITKHHTENQERWMRWLEKYQVNQAQIKGIVLTGWSRYDHYAILCELLPSGIPSLCLCLRMWLERKSAKDLNQTVTKILGYGETCPNGSTMQNSSLNVYNFPGWRVFVAMDWLANFRIKHRNTINSDEFTTWFNPWQLANGFTNRMHLDTILFILNSQLSEVLDLESNLLDALGSYYYKKTINEIMGALCLPIKENLLSLQRQCIFHMNKDATYDDSKDV